MKVSLNWVRQFIDFELPPVSELVEKIGAQLGAVESVEDLGAKYQGVLVAKVVSCKPHENSDHLNVCLIDDSGKAQDVERNEDGLVQVVCGAPNVRAGLTVAWLPPGSTVPESAQKDPFVLGKRELRGVMSSGMLASPRELALGDSHEGILEIDNDVEPGSDFAPVYKLDDYIIDIENKMFTHRPDCFGSLGVAREIAGILGHEFHSPDWYRLNPDLLSFRHPELDSGSSRNVIAESDETSNWIPDQVRNDKSLPLTVTNEIPELVPRFSAVTLADVQLGPSPVWLQVALAKVGQKSISNVVDLTNFYMLVTGQPLHAYDYDKVKALTEGDGAEISIRYPKPGERIKLINGKEIEPRSEAVCITSGDHLIGIGGVMGGYDTEVDENTKNIILEAANFDMYNIRRTSMAHGLFTDAVTRFNKGQSPLQTVAVLAKITGDIQKMTGAQVASELIDINQNPDRNWVHEPVPIATDFINARLGLELSAEAMKTLLENVEFTVQLTSEPANQLTIIAPFWRTDIETREDVVEEVGRLYGFDKLPQELPQRSIQPTAKDPMLELKRQVRETLAKAGANEVLTYSFVHADLLKKAGQDPEQAFKLSNALSPDLQHYRLSLTPSLLDKVHQNIKAGYDAFALFELGKAHVQDEPDFLETTIPKEVNALSFLYASKDNQPGAAYYRSRYYLDYLLETLQASDSVRFETLESADLYDNPWLKHMTAPFDPIRSVVLRDTRQALPGTDGRVWGIWGVAGELKASVRKAFKLPENTAGFELDPLLLSNQKAPLYVQLPRFPKVTQDISLEVAADATYGSVYEASEQALQAVLPDNTVADFQPLDIYQAEGSDKKRLTFRLEIASYDRTLTDAEVSKLLDAVAAAAKSQFGAERI